jgi:hypothetical protein
MVLKPGEAKELAHAGIVTSLFAGSAVKTAKAKL